MGKTIAENFKNQQLKVGIPPQALSDCWKAKSIIPFIHYSKYIFDN
ncbi:MAG: hypothetical protein JEY97_05575 [Bacteroidales bacterium]|nr:hypothetical protein [Bacteroidales bacterium]